MMDSSSKDVSEQQQLPVSASFTLTDSGQKVTRSAKPTGIYKRTGYPVVFMILLALLCLWKTAGWAKIAHRIPFYTPTRHGNFGHDLCPQADPLVPQTNGVIWRNLNKLYSTKSYPEQAAEWLGGAVRIPTESFDQMGPIDEDPRWEKFGELQAYLLKTFPLVHSTLELTKVNTYGLLYHWNGTNDRLKPLLLLGHQDVVPVDPQTVDQWEHPPFSGYFDGEKVWGRGSIDDKSGLIAILASLESLIGQGFVPTRTVIISFGFDEEVSGGRGAKVLATHLLERFGENSFAMLVDEGGSYAGFSEEFGAVIATPGVAEKGYFNVRLEVSSPGGHSSIPPAHTSIGMLSALLVKFEKNPYPIELERESPVYQLLQCLAEYAPNLDESVRKIIKESAQSDRALRKLEDYVSQDAGLKSLVSTTQAIDLIGGGVKANALPESAWAVVNHRIATQSSVRAVQKRDTVLLEELAEHFNLSFNAFGRDIDTSEGPKYGSLTLSDAWGDALEPAPVTPTGKDAAPFQLFSGSIKAVFDEYNRRDAWGDKDMIVAPGMMSGNTDTRYYWKLTQHIFRYYHSNMGPSKRFPGVHTVNEAAPVEDFVGQIAFYTTLILNADESKSL